MVRWRLCAVFALLVIPCAAVRYDMTKDEVVRELGKPASVLTQPGTGREIFNYPAGVRLEFAQGKLAVIQGLEPETDQAEVPTVAPPFPADLIGSAAEAPAPAPAAPDPAAAARAQAKADLAASQDRARADWERTIVALEARSEHPPPSPVPAFGLDNLLLIVGLNWLLLVGALRFNCKYWGVDIDWRGLMLAAAVDTGVRAVVVIAGRFLWHLPSLFHADVALAGCVLVFVLRRVSTNRSLQQAVTMTLTSKVFAIVLETILEFSLSVALTSATVR